MVQVKPGAKGSAPLCLGLVLGYSTGTHLTPRFLKAGATGLCLVPQVWNRWIPKVINLKGEQGKSCGQNQNHGWECTGETLGRKTGIQILWLSQPNPDIWPFQILSMYVKDLESTNTIPQAIVHKYNQKHLYSFIQYLFINIYLLPRYLFMKDQLFLCWSQLKQIKQFHE